MSKLIIREAQRGDGVARARIHGDMGAYYADLAPDHFQMPELDGLADVLDEEAGDSDDQALSLVAEVDGEAVGALRARLIAAEDGAEYQITPDSGRLRLRVEYVATAEPHRRSGVGTHLVEAAEAWGRAKGATVAETWTYHDSPLSLPFWKHRMGYEARSVNLRKPL